MLVDLLNEFMDGYLKNTALRVDSNTETHKLICNKIPNTLKDFDYLNKYYIKGSEGQGTRTTFPWVCLMDDSITRSPQKGIYIALLFKKDMSGFYLAINQGITYFKEKYRRDCYIKARSVANYFYNEISKTIENEYLPEISLGGEKPDNGYGFESTTVLGKFFAKDSFNFDEFDEALKDFCSVYDDISVHLGKRQYESVIPSILNDEEAFINIDKAIEENNKVIFNDERPFNQRISMVAPSVSKPRFKRLVNIPHTKRDYIKEYETNAKTGLLGENLVLKYEENRLISLGLDNYAKKIKQVSLDSDVYGYDIVSYDLDDNDKVIEIYIEVKTTSSKKNIDFYVSANEVNVSNKYKDRYWLYRVYDCQLDNPNPKFYAVKGCIEKNFLLTPETYRATLNTDPKAFERKDDIN